MTTLITGSRGFLASHLAEELRRRGAGARLIRLDRLAGRGHIICDLGDPAATRRAVLQFKPNLIYHLAGTTRPLGWEGLWEAHVAATINLMEAVRLLPSGARPKVVVAGSSAEYGRPLRLPVPETSPCDPLSTYGATKHSQTLVALSYGKEGIPVVVARVFNAVGPGIPENLALGAFLQQLSLIARGLKPPRVETGDLSARRDFVDARDAARALAELGRSGKPGEIYNVASGRAVSVAELLRLLIRVSGLRVSVRTDPARLRRDEVAAMAGDCRKLFARTGWRPRRSLAATLEDAWAWSRGREAP